jgi:L-idonate 5-dehydrogenase
MKAWVLHGSRDLRLESRPRPAASPGSVVIRVSRAGICGSDLHYYRDGRVGSFALKMPFVLGHELAGEVVEQGPGVSGLSTGDRVAVDPTIPCRLCEQCRRGRSNLCTKIRVLGSASSLPHLDGAFQEYVAVPASSCHKLPECVDDAMGALLEPLAVAAHALDRAGGVAGLRVLVTGAGAIGHCVLIVARALGAARIVVSDPDPFARTFAVEHGADDAVDPSAPGADARLAEQSAAGFDLAFEASGSPHALAQAFRVCARGATVVQVGTLPVECSLPAGLILSKELAYLGSFRYVNVFEKVLDLLTAKRISAAHVVTNVLPLDDLPAALETAAGAGDALKVQVRW